MGGGDLEGDGHGGSKRGRSPRGRGRRGRTIRSRRCHRSIPAWAGETRAGLWAGCGRAVDPRVGGGDVSAGCSITPPNGRSPRGRGRRHRVRVNNDPTRSIPAWAGETRSPAGRRPRRRVDPRVGGGDGHGAQPSWMLSGRSPRGRGRPPDQPPMPNLLWSIPAWAGETAGKGMATPRSGVDPRVGGGDRWSSALTGSEVGRSPRGRGRLDGAVGRREGEGSIPAWAGETDQDGADAVHLEVDPRVGGGDAEINKVRSLGLGRSPRGRGRRMKSVIHSASTGSIPAWAGETCAGCRPRS